MPKHMPFHTNLDTKFTYRSHKKYNEDEQTTAYHNRNVTCLIPNKHKLCSTLTLPPIIPCPDLSPGMWPFTCLAVTGVGSVSQCRRL